MERREVILDQYLDFQREHPVEKVDEFYHEDKYNSEKSERKEQERQEMKDDLCE